MLNWINLHFEPKEPVQAGRVTGCDESKQASSSILQPMGIIVTAYISVLYITPLHLKTGAISTKTKSKKRCDAPI